MQDLKSRSRDIESTLPPETLALWLEFGEFLRQRAARPLNTEAGGRELLELAGGLEDSKTFAGNPLDIQEALRREWN